MRAYSAKVCASPRGVVTSMATLKSATDGGATPAEDGGPVVPQ